MRRLGILETGLALGLLLACGGPDLQSRRLDRSIAIDGKSDEWRDALIDIEDTGVAVGAFNDQDALYLCISSSNQEVSLRAMDLGMTVWFTPRGGDGTRLGLEYPLLQDRLAHDRPGDSENPLLAGLENVPRVGLRGPGPSDRRFVTVKDVPGLEVTAAAVNGGFVYELKLPLARDAAHPFAVGAPAGGSVDLELETSHVAALPQARTDQARPRGGMGRRGRGPGRGGAGRGAGSDDGGAGRTKIPGPLKVSLQLRLAQ